MGVHRACTCETLDQDQCCFFVIHRSQIERIACALFLAKKVPTLQEGRRVAASGEEVDEWSKNLLSGALVSHYTADCKEGGYPINDAGRCEAPYSYYIELVNEAKAVKNMSGVLLNDDAFKKLQSLISERKRDIRNPEALPDKAESAADFWDTVVQVRPTAAVGRTANVLFVTREPVRALPDHATSVKTFQKNGLYLHHMYTDRSALSVPAGADHVIKVLSTYVNLGRFQYAFKDATMLR